MKFDLTSVEMTDKIEGWAKLAIVQLIAVGGLYLILKHLQKRKTGV
jgi:hypothetical protein